MIKLILTDIEGTTTPISFVHQQLFPYSAEHLESFVQRFSDQPDVRACLMSTNQTAKDELGVPLEQAGTIALLKKWIEEDRKHPALKTLQGLIWKQGYIRGELTTELYPEVARILRMWKEQKFQLGVYSSGSVEAQKQIFANTQDGDLSPLFDFFFDTEVGFKQDQQSYETIGEETGLLPEQILFLSDVGGELDAAGKVGLQTIQIVRPGTNSDANHRPCATFDDVASAIEEMSRG